MPFSLSFLRPIPGLLRVNLPCFPMSNVYVYIFSFITFLSVFSLKINLSCPSPRTFLSFSSYFPLLLLVLSCPSPSTFLSVSSYFPILLLVLSCPSPRTFLSFSSYFPVLLLVLSSPPRTFLFSSYFLCPCPAHTFSPCVYLVFDKSPQV